MKSKIEIDGETIELTEKQKKFCELYATHKEFFANGAQSYIEAYGLDINKKGTYNVAAVGAYDNLIKPNILTYINHLLELRGLNDTFVDKQLELLITQNADFPSKISAIREYNKLKSRIIKKVDVTQKGKVKIRKNRKGEIIKEYID